jgi:hypothetical protein
LHKKKLTYATPAHQIRAYAAALVMFGRAAVIDDGFSCRRETVLSSFVYAGAIGHYSVSGGFDGAARCWGIWWMEVKETWRERERDCLMSFIEWRDESGCLIISFPMTAFCFFFGWRCSGGCDCKINPH